MINGVERTHWGHLFSVSYLVGSIWVWLFEGDHPTTNGAVFFRAPRGEDAAAVDELGGAGRCCALICLYMLARKIRGAEVVR